MGNVATGAVVIQGDNNSISYQSKFPVYSGVLATAGGVLFAATAEGNLLALDSKTGALLDRFPTGSPMAAAPMSYAVDGKQFVAVMAGSVLQVYSLP